MYLVVEIAGVKYRPIRSFTACKMLHLHAVVGDGYGNSVPVCGSFGQYNRTSQYDFPFGEEGIQVCANCSKKVGLPMFEIIDLVLIAVDKMKCIPVEEHIFFHIERLNARS